MRKDLYVKKKFSFLVTLVTSGQHRRGTFLSLLKVT